MKKIAFLLISITILLAGCSGGNNNGPSIIEDNPTEEIMNALSLNDVKNGKSINPTLDTTQPYHDVKIAENIASSLFYDVIDLDDYFEGDRLKSVRIKTLQFNPIDSVSFLTELNNQDYGITKQMLGISLKETEGISENLCADRQTDPVVSSKLSLINEINLPADYNFKENDPAKLVVVYLPIYCVFNSDGENKIKSYMIVPVYYAFVYQSTLAEYTSGLKNYQISLNDQGYLPSKNIEG